MTALPYVKCNKLQAQNKSDVKRLKKYTKS